MMTDQVCKCCGQPLPEEIPSISLKGRSQRIFELVRGAGAVGLDAGRLPDLVYSDDPNGGPLSAAKSIQVLIHNLNKRHLLRVGYAIRGEHTGNGAFGRYRLVKCEAGA